MAFLLNSQAQGVSGKMNSLRKHHGAGSQRRGAQCSCVGCIGLRPALVSASVSISKFTVSTTSLHFTPNDSVIQARNQLGTPKVGRRVFERVPNFLSPTHFSKGEKILQGLLPPWLRAWC